MKASETAKARAKALAKEGLGYYPYIEELGLRTQAQRDAWKKADPREIELDFDPPF